MALTYYLTVDGVNGGSLSAKYKGAFNINEYQFDVSSIVDPSGNAGKPTFSPLVVNLDFNSGLTDLFSKVASGQIIRSIRLQGITEEGAAVYDLKLGRVSIVKYHDTNTGQDSLSFSYNRVVLTTTPQNPDGSLGTPVTTSWNIEANKAGATVPDPVASPGSSTGGGAFAYYLTIDGVNGGLLSENHNGAFDISGYKFRVTNLVDPSSGAGKPSFSPLVVNLDLNSGSTDLLSKVASGEIIRSIRLEGVTEDGSTVYDLKLGRVSIVKYHDTDTEQDSISFSYNRVVLTTTPRNSDESLGTPVTTSWNIAASRAGATVPDPVAAPNDISPTINAGDRTINSASGDGLLSRAVGNDILIGMKGDHLLAGRTGGDILTHSNGTSTLQVAAPNEFPWNKADWITNLKTGPDSINRPNAVNATNLVEENLANRLNEPEINAALTPTVSLAMPFLPLPQNPFPTLSLPSIL